MEAGQGELPASARAAITEAFKRHDVHGTGTITKDALHKLLQSLGGEFSSAELDKVFKQMDTNKDDMIQYTELVSWLFKDTFVSSASSASDTDKIHAALVSSLNRQCSIGQALSDLGIDITLDGEEPGLDDVISGLSSLSAQQLRELFQGADVDKSGHLQLSELQAFLFPDAATVAQSAVSVAKIFAQMDKNRDGKVMCGEFVAYMLERKHRMAKTASDADKRQIAAAWGGADGDGSGGVTLDELEHLLRCETSEEKDIARRCFESLDRDGNGRLNAAEFGRLFGKELLREATGLEVEWKAVPDDEDSAEENP